MKKIIYLFCLLICINCKSQEEDNPNSLIIDYINSNYDLENDNFLDNKKITINEIIIIYKRGRSIESSTNYKSIKWPFSNNEFDRLTEIDATTTANTSASFWKKEDFNNWITLISEDMKLENIAKKIMKDNSSIFQISNVYFNESKSKALLGIGIIKNLNIAEKFVLVFTKENNNWTVVNKIFDSTLH
jgi:hypothetical protein